MKTIFTFSKVRLSVMAVLTLFTLSIVSCNKDEDVEDIWELEGTWIHEYKDDDGNTLKDKFWFDPEAKYGQYRPAVGWKGDFWYSIKAPGILHVKITYYRYVSATNAQSWQEEVDWSCHKKGDRLWIEDVEYKKVWE